MSRPTPARALAFDVVSAGLEDGERTERAFRRLAEERGIEGRERAQAQRLAYGAVQRRGSVEAAIERLGTRPARALDPPVRNALRLGLYELLYAERTPDRAAVDQAVELVKRAGAGHAAGFVNAILRRAGRERQQLVSALADDSAPEAAAIAHSVPLWLAELWWRELGAEGARSLLAACNEPAEAALRVDSRAGGRERMLALLGESGIAAETAAGGWPLDPAEGLVLRGRGGPPVPELIAAGELTPQSRASMAVVEVLAPQPGEQVLDLCAGPGIKTGQIAARIEDRGGVISVELDPERAAEVAAQADRLGLRSVTVMEADAAALEMPPGFDRVLLDAPCSDLGTLAARPDLRWRKSPRTIERLAELQAEMLKRAAAALGPGGVLVYSTCTISRRENEDQVAALLEEGAPGLLVDDLGERAPDLASSLDSRFLQLRPDRDRTSGFFIARLRRDD